MRETPLEPAVPAGVDPVQRAREICQVREAMQSSARAEVSPRTRVQSVIRPVIGQDWGTMVREGVNPHGAVPRLLDPRELESLRNDPDLILTKQVLFDRLGLVRDLEIVATVHDGRGCVVWAGGNTKMRDEADRYGLYCGAQSAEMGTNGVRLVTQCHVRSAQIYGPEHWMDFQSRWACTAAGVLDPRTGRLLAVINVTGPWAKVHGDTLGWLYEIARRIEDALPTAQHRRQWGRLAEAAGRLERISGPALVIDCDGVVVDAHEWTCQAGDRVLPEAAGTVPGRTFLPALGWCVLEPLPALGWLVRPSRQDEDEPVIRATLDLTVPTQPWVRVSGPNVSWHCRVRPLHAKILQRLANRPCGLTEAELREALYGAGAKTNVSPELSKLRKELGGLLHPTSHKPGDNRYRFGQSITVDIQSCAVPAP